MAISFLENSGWRLPTNTIEIIGKFCTPYTIIAWQKSVHTLTYIYRVLQKYWDKFQGEVGGTTMIQICVAIHSQKRLRSPLGGGVQKNIGGNQLSQIRKFLIQNSYQGWWKSPWHETTWCLKSLLSECFGWCGWRTVSRVLFIVKTSNLWRLSYFFPRGSFKLTWFYVIACQKPYVDFNIMGHLPIRAWITDE